MYADYQIVKKEVNPAWGRPPFLYYKDNTILSEMQIAFLGGLVEICEKSLQMRVGEIASGVNLLNRRFPLLSTKYPSL